jgi:hypothetical protein
VREGSGRRYDAAEVAGPNVVFVPTVALDADGNELARSPP